ncbi:MAG: hypothetical protein KAS32_08520 [Candidatus Peribacteraceae bacterium]|nr:hypothetical protein [Candidatus Peribacteraceae bacterium]
MAKYDNIKRRLLLPEVGVDDIIFYTASGLIIANGYNRVVIGDRGPYIEFIGNQIYKHNIFIPKNEKWRQLSPNSFYIEYRSKCDSYVKLYFQIKTVSYADYKVGLWYIDPKELTSSKYKNLIGNSKEPNDKNITRFD